MAKLSIKHVFICCGCGWCLDGMGVNVPLCVGGSKGKQGYKCDVSLKGGIQIMCTLGNDATLYIDITKPLLIVGLNLLIWSI